jgi:hypothetical protein
MNRRAQLLGCENATSLATMCRCRCEGREHGQRRAQTTGELARLDPENDHFHPPPRPRPVKRLVGVQTSFIEGRERELWI